MRDMELSSFFSELFNYSSFQTATSTNLFQGGCICIENHVDFFVGNNVPYHVLSNFYGILD